MGQRLLYFQYRRFHAVCQGQGRAFLLPFQLELQGLDDALFKAGDVSLADAQGGGGFLLVYCPYNVKHQVARRLEAAGGQLMDWNFELRGAQSWICDEDRWDYRDIQVQMPDKEYTFHV